ncbi:Ran GTPase binding protein Sbp1 [Tieghemiomyces parasiticus]|uniref:Ran GTPase binding protein Sbp1 n=1 Tax=Tieghemiomyces parasiticus TaxID=78921 RepID=A0A9W7ZRL3_9FUNG|nr:Ran GTPase binding protein Sbp1 [Tieghemiomyces parasiticus]
MSDEIPKTTPVAAEAPEEVEASADVHFEPLVKLEEVEVKTLEEDETPVFKMRAKLFRFSKPDSEWKERGTGDVKLLLHKKKHTVRVLMRRDKTLKICANHLITEDMTLSPNIGSERSWVWNVAADIADGEPKQELLAIRLANADNAQLFKKKFNEARENNVKVKRGEDPLDLTSSITEAGTKQEEAAPKKAEEAKTEEKKAEETKADEKKAEEATA